MGGLAVLEKSHSLPGLATYRRTYGRATDLFFCFGALVCIAMAYIAMAYIVMAYRVMAYICYMLTANADGSLLEGSSTRP